MEEVIISFIRHIKVIYCRLGLELIYSLAVSQSPDVGPGPAVFISGFHLETTKDEDTVNLPKSIPHAARPQSQTSCVLGPGVHSSYKGCSAP